MALMTHEIKSHSDVFQARWTGLKTWEFRCNDRDFKVGDFLHEREIEPRFAVGGSPIYTGRSILSLVMYVREGGQFGIPKDYCVMSVETVAAGKWLPRQEAR